LTHDTEDDVLTHARFTEKGPQDTLGTVLAEAAVPAVIAVEVDPVEFVALIVRACVRCDVAGS
jgi:hypothetical protein